VVAFPARAETGCGQCGMTEEYSIAWRSPAPIVTQRQLPISVPGPAVVGRAAPSSIRKARVERQPGIGVVALLEQEITGRNIPQFGTDWSMRKAPAPNIAGSRRAPRAAITSIDMPSQSPGGYRGRFAVPTYHGQLVATGFRHQDFGLAASFRSSAAAGRYGSPACGL